MVVRDPLKSNIKATQTLGRYTKESKLSEKSTDFFAAILRWEGNSMKLHYTTSVYIKHNEKILLHKHPKLGMIIPVGGQIRTNEVPEEAARREIKEETGLDIMVIGNHELLKFADSVELTKPVHIMLEEASVGHQCVCFIFYAVADTYELTPQDGETKELMWLTEGEIRIHESISEYVKCMALNLLHLIHGE